MAAEFTDIAFPNNNEKDFIEIAKRLEIKGMLFCYEYDKFKRRSEGIQNDKIKINYAVFAAPHNLAKAKALSLPLLINRNDRFIFEHSFSKGLIMFELEGIAKYDSLHSRHSGLNHILCRLAEKNNIALGVSFSQLLNSSPPKRPEILGRAMQNIRLARKYKMKIKLASFARNPYEMRACNDLLSLGTVLGMHPSEAKMALRGMVE